MRYNTGSRGEIVGVLSYSLYTYRGTPYITPKRSVKEIYF